MIGKLARFAQENERHLGAFVFVAGFIGDLLTFGLLEVRIVNLIFLGYLVGATLAIFFLHVLADGRERPSLPRRILLVALPLLAQFLIGGMLSGFLIYYTKSSVLSVSWPFVVLLVLIFLGNEWFRKYKDRLIFLATLLFFTIYAYAIFALPLYIHRIGPWIFLLSTLVTVLLFAGFLYLLYRTGKARLLASLKSILVACAAILILILTSYFSGLIPPIPLSMKEAGMYHDLSRRGSEYVLMKEEGRVWWNPFSDTVRVAPGDTLYAYTAVFAPIRFDTVIVHRWERYDKATRKWMLEGAVAFPIAGGRVEGYRGYSERGALTPGVWRVSVETLNGQVIGRLKFSVQEVAVTPPLREVVR